MGDACIFTFDRATMKGACGCGASTGGNGHPTRPIPPFTHTSHSMHPTRSMQPHMQNCDAWDEKGTDVSNKDTCTAICKDHRTTFDSYTAATDVTDATCCCAAPQTPRAGDRSSVCCAVPDVPEPSREPVAKDCGGAELMECAATTGEVVTSCAMIFMNSLMECDILAPAGSAAAAACDAPWDCAVKAAGPDDFKKCCSCIEQTAQMFDKDLDIPCEVVG